MILPLTNPLAKLAAQEAALDIPAFMTTLRAALLMQVRWIEDHVKPDDPHSEYFGTVRRSNLEVIRHIEHELGLKPKRRKVLRRRLP